MHRNLLGRKGSLPVQLESLGNSSRPTTARDVQVSNPPLKLAKIKKLNLSSLNNSVSSGAGYSQDKSLTNEKRMNRKSDLKKKIKSKLLENSDLDLHLASVTGNKIPQKASRSISNTHRGSGPPTRADFPSIMSHRTGSGAHGIESATLANKKKVQTARNANSGWTETKDHGMLNQIDNMKSLINKKEEMVDLLKRKSKPADEVKALDLELKTRKLKLEKVKFRIDALRQKEIMEDLSSQKEEASRASDENFDVEAIEKENSEYGEQIQKLYLKYNDLRKEKFLKPEFGIKTCLETNLLKLKIAEEQILNNALPPKAPINDENSQTKLALIEKCNFYRSLVNEKYHQAVKYMSTAGSDISNNPKKLEFAEKLKVLHEIK